MLRFVAAALAATLSLAHAAETGIASIYTTRENGRTTACGIPLDDAAMTAAHKTLPCGTRVRVTNTKNGKSAVVTITDRGPYVPGRIIDLTLAAAAAIGLSADAGIGPVTVEKE